MSEWYYLYLERLKKRHAAAVRKGLFKIANEISEELAAHYQKKPNG